MAEIKLTLLEVMKRAVAAYQSGQLSEADRLARAVLSVKADYFDALHLLAVVKARQRRFGEALASYDRALAVRPDFAEVLYNRGITLYELKRFDEALTSYDRALAVRPDFADVLYNRGITLHELKRFGEALTSYDRALAVRPNSVEVLYNRGNTLRELKRCDEALASYDRALALRPDFAEVLYNRGIARHELKRFDEALASYDRALAVRPDFAEVLHYRGITLHELKRLDEALASYDRALAVRPDFAGVLYNRGNTLRELKRFDEALASFERGIAIDPDVAQAHIMRGGVLESLNRFEHALASYDRAAAIDPNVPDAHIIRGDLLRKLDRPQEALASYDGAVAVSPDHALAHDRRGLVLVELGRLTEGRGAHETAVALAPRKASFYYNLTAVAQIKPDGPFARAMKNLSRDIASLDWEEQTALHFALAKMFADNADYKQSFRHLLDGNALKRKQVHYDESATLAANDNLRAMFTRKLIGANQGVGEPAPVPVFVVGMPRSGSTLVEQLLSSHPKVFGAGEIADFFDAAVEVGGANLEALNFSGEHSKILRDQLRQIGADYMKRIGRAAPAAERIVDKTLDNFRLLGLIHLALPNARIIHIRRDPVDTCVSCFSKLFVGANVSYAYDLAELGRYYRSYDLVMAHWHDLLPPNVLLDVQYEDLVANIEEQTRRMIAHCGLEWDARCLNFHLTERPVRTASAVQVRQPIYKTSVGQWRKYEPFLSSLLSALGPSSSPMPK
jgi:tetratricopeptide (TPR) repeat protein